jgi:DNA-binding transcriptional ArsR family regulator
MPSRRDGVPMADALGRPPPDYASLAEFLAALGYQLRLELLDQLRFPHTLGELRVAPQRKEAGQAPERPAARQTVQGHLDRLVEADLVRVENVTQGGRTVPRYVVNSLKLYELTEELRRLVVRYAGRGPAGDATGTVASVAAGAAVHGPRLVLVHGVYEGKAFLLEDRTAEGGQWVIGRRRDAPIALDYDPFVSLENAVVTGRKDRFSVTDLGSKNGTFVNWGQLPRASSHALKAGDVIGVGRSLLVFVPE